MSLYTMPQVRSAVATPGSARTTKPVTRIAKGTSRVSGRRKEPRIARIGCNRVMPIRQAPLGVLAPANRPCGSTGARTGPRSHRPAMHDERAREAGRALSVSPTARSSPRGRKAVRCSACGALYRRTAAAARSHRATPNAERSSRSAATTRGCRVKHRELARVGGGVRSAPRRRAQPSRPLWSDGSHGLVAVELQEIVRSGDEAPLRAGGGASSSVESFKAAI